MTTQAIFLSYASQDADVARRICEALRSAGSKSGSINQSFAVVMLGMR